jgi:hypothetical protein
MDSRFSTFERFREQERVRIGPSDYLPEGIFHPPKPAPPEIPNPRWIIATPQMEFTDVVRIREECDHIYPDILRLRAELAPLRQRVADLEDYLSEIDRRRIIRNRKFHPKARQSPWPRVDHKSTAEILRVKREKDNLTVEWEMLMDRLQPETLESLRNSIQINRRQVRALRAQIPENAQALLVLQTQIAEMKMNVISDEVQRHDLVIRRLESEIENQIQIRKKMKNELAKLQEFSIVYSEAEMDASGENPRVMQELKKAMNHKRQKSFELGRLLKEQEQDVIIERLKDECRVHNLTSIFLGWFENGITEEDLRDLCGSFGDIRDISIGTRNHKGELKHCAYVDFENNQSARRAIGQLNGLIDDEGKPLIAVWNDEQKPAPPTEERSRAGRPRRFGHLGQKRTKPSKDKVF